MSRANINIIGNLTKDPTMSQAAGSNVCRLSVAVTTAQKGEDGNYIANYYDCSIWGKRAETVANYAQKGTMVAVTGDLVMMPYTANDGTSRTACRVNASSVELLARIKGKDGASAPAQHAPARAAAPAATQTYMDPSADGDELPF